MTFLRVDAKQAGPQAIGILVPHGAKTLVVVRPRALTCDLLPARWDGDSSHAPEFCVFTRDEAARLARRFIKALETSVIAGLNPVQTFGDAQCFQIWLRAEEFVWVMCRRAPGQAYRPMIFTTCDEATREAEKLSAFVWPAAQARQEYYFNTQNCS